MEVDGGLSAALGFFVLSKRMYGKLSIKLRQQGVASQGKLQVRGTMWQAQASPMLLPGGVCKHVQYRQGSQGSCMGF